MAYPTKESNDSEGGTPSQSQSKALGDFVQSETQADSRDTDGQYDQVTVGPLTDRSHPHQNAEDRKPGDHPHKDYRPQGK